MYLDTSRQQLAIMASIVIIANSQTGYSYSLWPISASNWLYITA